MSKSIELSQVNVKTFSEKDYKISCSDCGRISSFEKAGSEGWIGCLDLKAWTYKCNECKTRKGK